MGGIWGKISGMTLGIEGGNFFGEMSDAEKARRIESQESSLAGIYTRSPQPSRMENVRWGEGGITFTWVMDYVLPVGRGVTLPLYEARGHYGNRKEDLSQLGDRRCYFTGADRFFAHDPPWLGEDLDFGIIGIAQDRLTTGMWKMAGIRHEQGHLWLARSGMDVGLMRAVKLDDARVLPSGVRVGDYAWLLEQAANKKSWLKEKVGPKEMMEEMIADTPVGRVMSFFHERTAWAAGYRLHKRGIFPSGFRNSLEWMDYARACLCTYGDVYAMPLKQVLGSREAVEKLLQSEW